MSETAPRPRPAVLCVDDEPQILAAIEATLRRHFSVTTATSGADGLRRLADGGPFAVVVSDFAMPDMNGAEFLARVREVAPDAVRLLLTGQATVEGAIAAVNEGNVFRFLTKPCPPPVLLRALEDAVEQTRLVTADRALLEQKLESMSAHLVRAERLASLGTMAGAIGHEMNNMLTVLIGSTGIIEHDARCGAPLDPDAMATLRQVQQHLTVHARNLLELGRPPRLGADTMHTDIRQAVADVLAMLRLAGVLRHLHLRLDLSKAPVLVAMPPLLAQQVLLNLIKNAVDAFSERPRAEAAIEIAIAADATAGTAQCRISDNAGGIAADVVSSVFDPYFTTKSPERGTGLGLFVVRHAMHECHGHIDVESTPGEGTSFTLHFPLAGQPTGPASSTRHAA